MSSVMTRLMLQLRPSNGCCWNGPRSHLGPYLFWPPEIWASKNLVSKKYGPQEICSQWKSSQKPNFTDTVTDLANSCVTPLFRHPQGYQECLEGQNYPLSLNLVVWCAKIGPKTQKVWKTSKLTKKMSKTMVFWRVFKVSWFWAQF